MAGCVLRDYLELANENSGIEYADVLPVETFVQRAVRHRVEQFTVLVDLDTRRTGDTPGFRQYCAMCVPLRPAIDIQDRHVVCLNAERIIPDDRPDIRLFVDHGADPDHRRTIGVGVYLR